MGFCADCGASTRNKFCRKCETEREKLRQRREKDRGKHERGKHRKRKRK